MTLDQAFDDAFDRLAEVGFDQLAEREKTLVALAELEAEVDDGGFDQFFSSEASEFSFFIPTALRAIGATCLADITERANALLGTDGPSRDTIERSNQLELMTDEQCDELEELDVAFEGCEESIRDLLALHLNLD